jgi:hypothetical protein
MPVDGIWVERTDFVANSADHVAGPCLARAVWHDSNQLTPLIDRSWTMSTGRMGRRPSLTKRVALIAAVGAVFGGGLWILTGLATPSGPADVVWTVPVAH